MSTRRRFGRIRKLPSGRWQARYATPDGIERTAPSTFPTKTAAALYLARTEVDLDRGQWTDPRLGRVTVSAWAVRYMAAASHLKPKTRGSYESLLRATILPSLGSLQFARVQPITISEWVASLSARNLSPSRVRQSYRLISQIMSAAVENDMIAASPCRSVGLPKMPETQPHTLTVDQVEQLAEAAREPHGVLVYLLAYGGLRIGEALALRRRHVDLLRGRLVIAESLSEVGGRLTVETTKTHQQRVLTLPTFLLDRLTRHLDQSVLANPEALLFVGRTGRALHYNSWRRAIWDPAVAKAALFDVTPHDLRATCATWVAAEDGVMEAAKRLGHSRASITTRHYARAVDGQDEAVAARLDRARSAALGVHTARRLLA